ncbi:MAG: nucleotidyltransferase domain-containing protein [Rhodocyclales bacterium]|nr:nucleotidyltransferase domain-containing protein [Rhodocyclales bacterium]
MTMLHATFPPHLTPFERSRLEALLARLAAEPLLSRVVVFGSRARGRSRADSDLDLAVYFASPRSRHLERWLDAQATAGGDDFDAPRLQLVPFFAGEPPNRLDTALKREGIVLWTKN